MGSLAQMTAEGYGAASFGLTGETFNYLEIQVLPGLVKIYRRNTLQKRGSLMAGWTSRDVWTVAASVCNGDCPPAILADCCDENAPDRCDGGFEPSKWLRLAI